MTKQECLKRAAECNRLAEATSEPDMKLYLMKNLDAVSHGGGRRG
jgi:hypothetical protein